MNRGCAMKSIASSRRSGLIERILSPMVPCLVALTDSVNGIRLRCVKRTELLRKIGTAARITGIPWAQVHQGSRHEIWQCGTTAVSIPRHREVNEHTAEGIFQDLEGELGKGWWR